MERSTKLVISVAIDLLGLVSYVIPFWGEALDLFFAWIEAGWIYYAYRSKKLAIFGGLEELLPFVDIIPGCTIAHFLSKETADAADDAPGRTIDAAARTVSSKRA